MARVISAALGVLMVGPAVGFVAADHATGHSSTPASIVLALCGVRFAVAIGALIHTQLALQVVDRASAAPLKGERQMAMIGLAVIPVDLVCYLLLSMTRSPV